MTYIKLYLFTHETKRTHPENPEDALKIEYILKANDLNIILHGLFDKYQDALDKSK